MHAIRIKTRLNDRLFRRACLCVLAAALLLTAAQGRFARGDEAVPPEPGQGPDDLSKRTLLMKTLGGRQLWGDVLHFHGWRIQKNVLTGHHRLLDTEDFRHASGTFAECRQKLDEIKQQQKLPRMSGKAVILVHGIVRSSKSFSKMRAAFEDEGYHVFSFDYPSTRVEIPEAAEYLHSVIDSLEGIEEINLVVHSMGGLVVRAYLREHQDERIRRLVMIGVPNLGAKMADRLQSNLLYKAIFGPAGGQLTSNPEGFISQLPVPGFEFAVIAGCRGTPDGYNVLIPGDDDATVSVASTQLPGATDFVAVKGLHSFLTHNEAVIAHAVRFIKDGQLRQTGERQPIPKPSPSTANAPMNSPNDADGRPRPENQSAGNRTLPKLLP